jgi:hypothetical protein
MNDYIKRLFLNHPPGEYNINEEFLDFFLIIIYFQLIINFHNIFR